MDYKKAVGRRVKQARESAHLSQSELAEIVDVNTGTISTIERGINFPSMELFIKLINQLGTSADVLLQDVQPKGYIVYESELAKKVENADEETKKFIYRMVDTALAKK